MDQKIFILYEQHDYEQVELLMEEVNRGLDGVVCGASTVSDLVVAYEELVPKFMDRSREHIKESVAVYILGSHNFFGTSILTSLAQEAIAANKAIFITMPNTKIFPVWYPRSQAIKLFTRITMIRSAFEELLKLTKPFLV